MESVVDIRNVSFGYENKRILNNIHLTVSRGDFMGIIGPNGSGKSTILKLMLGLIKTGTGDIRVLGEDIHHFSQWSKIGYISQKAASFNGSFPATVEEVVAANLYSQVGLFRSIGRSYREKVTQALSLVGMEEYRNSFIGNLSGGQQQRVFIARVLVSKPEIIFLDEPTVGIDARSEEAVYCLLARLNQELGITIIMVTHDIGAITAHANKLACLGSRGLTVHNPQEEEAMEFISETYGYKVNLHMVHHDCTQCLHKGGM